MATFAAVSDVTKRLGRPTPAEGSLEHEQITAWLEDVEGMIVRRLGPLEALVAAEHLDEATVKRVECNAVERKAWNPSGVRTSTRQMDDWSRSETRDKTLSDGQLRILDEEWAELLADLPTGGDPQGPYSVPLGTPVGLPSWT